MFSKTTIFLFLLATTIFIGIDRWDGSHRDACSSYLAGDLRAPAVEYVESGSRTIVIPCNYWLMRLPLDVQIWCFGWLVCVVVLLVSLINDVRARRERIKGLPLMR